MNIEEAILAHARWKIKLMTYLRNPDGSINVGDLQADNKCALGSWIYEQAARYGGTPEFAALKAAHAKFHRAAANVVRKADTGQIANPDSELGLNSDFGAASSSVVNSIKTFAKKIA